MEVSTSSTHVHTMWWAVRPDLTELVCYGKISICPSSGMPIHVFASVWASTASTTEFITLQFLHLGGKRMEPLRYPQLDSVSSFRSIRLLRKDPCPGPPVTGSIHLFSRSGQGADSPGRDCRWGGNSCQPY